MRDDKAAKLRPWIEVLESKGFEPWPAADLFFLYSAAP